MLVLEREASLRLEGSAIAMWANAFRALEAVGVAGPLRAAHPLLERWADFCCRHQFPARKPEADTQQGTITREGSMSRLERSESKPDKLGLIEHTQCGQHVRA